MLTWSRIRIYTPYREHAYIYVCIVYMASQHTRYKVYVAYESCSISLFISCVLHLHIYILHALHMYA